MTNDDDYDALQAHATACHAKVDAAITASPAHAPCDTCGRIVAWDKALPVILDLDAGRIARRCFKCVVEEMRHQ